MVVEQEMDRKEFKNPSFMTFTQDKGGKILLRTLPKICKLCFREVCNSPLEMKEKCDSSLHREVGRPEVEGVEKVQEERKGKEKESSQ